MSDGFVLMGKAGHRSLLQEKAAEGTWASLTWTARNHGRTEIGEMLYVENTKQQGGLCLRLTLSGFVDSNTTVVLASCRGGVTVTLT